MKASNCDIMVNIEGKEANPVSFVMDGNKPFNWATADLVQAWLPTLK